MKNACQVEKKGYADGLKYAHIIDVIFVYFCCTFFFGQSCTMTEACFTFSSTFHYLALVQAKKGVVVAKMDATDN